MANNWYLVACISHPIPIQNFHSHLKHIMERAKTTKGKLQPEVIIGMDHNIDLLKGLIHNPMWKFIDSTSNLDLLPTITHPSRITSYSAMLIDNIYVSESLHRSYESVILINDMSDHQPLIAMLKQTKFLSKELKHHQNLYNKLKCIAKEDYYKTKCVQFKENSKKL